MKNVLIYVLFLSVLATGCTKKTDELFDETVDERLNTALTNYQNALSNAPGWKLFVYPSGLLSQGIEVGGLTYYVKFSADNRVTMVSDFNLPMAGTPKESSYRLRAAQRPSLIFDTYSYIHVAADPDENVSFSPAQAGGYGWGTDFDFAFTAATPADTIRLSGNFNGSEAFLIKASQAEMDAAFANGRLAEIVAATSEYSTNNPFLYFPGTDNAKVGVSFNLFLYIVNFTYLGSGGQLVTISQPFSHTTEGIRFKNPVNVGGYTFQEAFSDDAAEVYYIEAGGTRVNIINSPTPLFPFNLVLGRSITTISVPVDPLPGQSALFTQEYNLAASNLINSPYTLELGDMNFIFDDASKTMALVVIVFQGPQPFQLQYIYSYSLNASNQTQFNLLGLNGNGDLVRNEMMPILKYIENDVFKLDYFTGSAPVLGQFTSLTRPQFFFTGTLQ
jgi:hypothetical protein